MIERTSIQSSRNKSIVVNGTNNTLDVVCSYDYRIGGPITLSLNGDKSSDYRGGEYSQNSIDINNATDGYNSGDTGRRYTYKIITSRTISKAGTMRSTNPATISYNQIILAKK